MLSTIPIDTKEIAVLALEPEARPVYTYDGDTRGPQATDPATGALLWRLKVLLASPGEAGEATVKFAAPAAVKVDLMKPLKVEGLSGRIVRGTLYLSASSIAPKPQA